MTENQELPEIEQFLRDRIWIGDLVKLRAGEDVRGYVTGVCYRGRAFITYEVTWVHDGAVQCGWFQQFEIEKVEP